MGATKKTESLTVRLDPKLKYGLELMAREQNRTITGVVEWAISFAISHAGACSGDCGMLELVNDTWSTDEITRLVRLSLAAPHLLTYEELRVWETILLSDGFWRTKERKEGDIDWHSLRNAWELLLAHVKEHERHGAIVPFCTGI